MPDVSKPNIIWITLDSVRYDHTSLSGYHRDTTPTLERIAESSSGRSFEACFSHAIWTLPSSTSILTGTYPTRHNVMTGESQLGDSPKTVAELLSEVGYRTACLSRNSYLSTATNLVRGFDQFEWLNARRLPFSAGLRTTLKYVANLRHHSAGFSLDSAKHSTPFVMNDIAKRWIRSLEREEPFFFYLHYNEPHSPFYPPIPYLDRYTSDLEMSGREAASFALEVHNNLESKIANGCDFTREQWAALNAMYDAEIAYTDACIGRLIDYIEARDLGETAVVITADHGELLGEHGLLGHTEVLDDALIHVPLVTSGVGDWPISSDQLLQHIDVMQTLVGSAGGDTSQMQGVDLRTESRDFAIAQRGPRDVERFKAHNPSFDTSSFHASTLTCLRTATFKYQRSEGGQELFELPNETDDVSEAYPAVCGQLDQALDEWFEEEGQPVDSIGEAEFTRDMERQLRDLGYLR